MQRLVGTAQGEVAGEGLAVQVGLAPLAMVQQARGQQERPTYNKGKAANNAAVMMN